MSVSVKHTLTTDGGPIHSMVWEDCEAMEGQDHSVLVTANRARASMWDLEQLTVT